jgi:hypothetical protein
VILWQYVDITVVGQCRTCWSCTDSFADVLMNLSAVHELRTSALQNHRGTYAFNLTLWPSLSFASHRPHFTIVLFTLIQTFITVFIRIASPHCTSSSMCCTLAPLLFPVKPHWKELYATCCLNHIYHLM